ncbi:hypothetical protein [Oxynema aestuarii]|jgi:hypothetical protein|uniref:Uncharacterized protein n=1 Tax=Oxynema aestuarii AP17 TaxID=2064643 RepID=A0A6H1TTG3_9CYAN|nr:hypothetical protein [Oxynema aestuarii]QIZ69506.1 hypothetical protein HCG48_01990 [Oxynema aestuarii AP17]RMH73876.1 MAG: hypothetical protein D6680_15770 [Cyanobacteria bacterium J007]
MQKVFLFLSIDGVLNVTDSGTPQLLSTHMPAGLLEESYEGAYGFPVSLARSFLQAVDRAEWIEPIWFSAQWLENATVWNEWSATRHWRIGYPLSMRQMRGLVSIYPKLNLEKFDGKTLAAIWHAHDASRVVWIQESFDPCAIAWAAKDSRIHLIDTRHPSDPSYNGIQPWNIDGILSALSLELEAPPSPEPPIASSSGSPPG